MCVELGEGELQGLDFRRFIPFCSTGIGRAVAKATIDAKAITRMFIRLVI